MDYTPTFPISSDSLSGDSECYGSLASDCLLVEDQLEAMLALEKSYQVKFIPCTNSKGDDTPSQRSDWRTKICDWSYRVVDHFRIERDIVSISMNLFDRFLSMQRSMSTSCRCPSCQRAVDSRTFQLAAMTTLYMAIKLHGESSCRSSRKRLRLVSMVDLSRGQFSHEDVCEMERRVLATLSWKVNPTTPSTIVAFLLRLMPPHEAILRRCRPTYNLVLHVLNELARYLSEVSVCLSTVHSYFLPSEVAYACIVVAMQLLSSKALPMQVRQDFWCAVQSMLSLSSDIPSLVNGLREAFVPETLLAESVQHPIGHALDIGLLDLEQFHSSKEKNRMHDRSGSLTSVMEIETEEYFHIVESC